MSTSIMVHDVTSVSTDVVPHYDNANSVTLRIHTDGYGGKNQFDVTLFNLPREAAEHLARSLSVSWSRNEDDIRADERRRIAAKLEL